MNEMAEHFSASRIVFNNAINNDLNMRVFEALCSGSMLVTDRALGSGLDEFFADKKHLIIYDDEIIEQTITHYLNNEPERERIANEGRKEVLAKHTYCHRTDTMIQILDKQIGSIEKKESKLMNEKPPSYYENVRNDLIPLIPMDATHILEVGCATGMTGRELKKRNGAFVAGLEFNAEAAREAKKNLDDVIEGDIEKIDLPYSDNTFDCIFFADVLEHLVDPLSALLKVKRLLKKEGTIVASIPNVQFHGVIHKLIEGNWTYEKEGILDETHLRFFTYKEIIKLFSQAGYSIQKVEEVLDPQYEKFLTQNTTTLNFGRTQVKDLSPEEIKRFFVFQYQVIATPINTNKNAVIDKYEGGERLSQLDHLLLQASEELDSGKLNRALKHFGEIIKISPENTEALIGMGDCYMKLQTPDKADTLYKEACLKEPNNPRAWLHSGLLALHKNNIKKADICFNKCLDKDTNNDKAYCGLGMLRIRGNDIDGAVDYFCKSLDANPENLSACKFLLEISYKLKDFAKVEIYLSRYIEFHPGNLNMRFALAGIQYKRGKVEDSINNLECILALNPKHESAQEMLDNIRTDLVLSK